jgi:hypothetical protein
LCTLPAFTSSIIADYCCYLGKQPTISRLFDKQGCGVFVLPCLLDAKEVSDAHYANTLKEGNKLDIAMFLHCLLSTVNYHL